MIMRPSPSIEYIQLPHLYFGGGIERGKRLVIAAESTQGDYYNPLPIGDVEYAKHVFGSGPLIDRYSDVSLFEEDVYLMRIERNAFHDVFKCLAPFPLDLLYVDGLYFDQHYDEIQAFIDFAKEKEHQGQLIHGFINISKDADIDQVKGQIRQLSIITEDGTEETGKYLSAVLNQFKNQSAAAVYAGLVASLDVGKSPVNKTIDNVELSYEVDDKIKEYRGAGIVCFRQSFKKGVVCASAPCAVATKDSVHKQISNFRIAQDIINEIAIMQQAYVGRIGFNLVVSELETLTEELLLNRVGLQQIRKYDFEITGDPINGIINTSIEVVPIFSIQSMTGYAQVKVRL